MRSDIYEFQQDHDDFRNIPAVAEKVAEYNDLNKKQTMRLRLLAEEMICMLPQLMKYGAGEFWIENSGGDYELHINVISESYSDSDREKLLSVAKSGKNAAAKGIVNKVIVAVTQMLANMTKHEEEVPYDFYEMGMTEYGEYSAWSLMSYKNCVEQGYENVPAREPEKWDELEKSILANLADDVIVGVVGNKVSITVKKHFDV